MTSKPNKILSIIIVVKNAEKVIGTCLSFIRRQSYPVELVEILVIDGGSVDKTKLIAEEYGVKFVNGGYSDNQEARRFIGVQLARGEIIVFIDADNFMENKNWLHEMTMPFNNTNVGCSFTKWYGISKTLSYVDNYYALLGGNDPVAYYLGKHDRVPIGIKSLPFGANLIKRFDGLDLVWFSVDKIPTLGANGFLIRADLIKSLNIEDPEVFYHTDIHVDLIRKNPKLVYAIIWNDIVHATGGSLLANIKKRLVYKGIHNDKLAKKRRYAVYNPKSFLDNLRLIYVVLAAITLIDPMARAIIGFCRTKRLEWFLHPVATISMVAAYFYSQIMCTNKR